MKQFVVCPNCGAIQLSEVFSPKMKYPCDNCSEWDFGEDWKPAKAISIKQPWAYLICSGIKDIENRTWKTNFRGRVLIHSGVKPMKMINPCDIFTQQQWDIFSYEKKVNVMCLGLDKPLSAIIGSVEIVDCVINHESVWAEKSFVSVRDGVINNPNNNPIYYNWVLKNPVLFEKPIPCKGKLSFFTPQIPD